MLSGVFIVIAFIGLIFGADAMQQDNYVSEATRDAIAQKEF